MKEEKMVLVEKYYAMCFKLTMLEVKLNFCSINNTEKQQINKLQLQ